MVEIILIKCLIFFFFAELQNLNEGEKFYLCFYFEKEAWKNLKTKT